MTVAAKQGQYKIPFDDKGNQLDYPFWYWRDGVKIENEWVDNFVFVDTLTYTSYSTGRSAIGFNMTRTNGTTVNVFISDFSAMIPLMVDGRITGRFTFVKKGTSYGCKYVGPVSV